MGLKNPDYYTFYFVFRNDQNIKQQWGIIAKLYSLFSDPLILVVVLELFMYNFFINL